MTAPKQPPVAVVVWRDAYFLEGKFASQESCLVVESAGWLLDNKAMDLDDDSVRLAQCRYADGSQVHEVLTIPRAYVVSIRTARTFNRED